MSGAVGPVVRPGDDYQLVEPEATGQFGQAGRDLFARADECFSAHSLDAGALSVRIRVCRGLFRRDERLPDSHLSADTRVLACQRQAPGFVFGVGREGPYADGRLRLRVARTGAVIAAVELQCLLHAFAIREEIGKGVRQSEMRRQLRAVIRAAEYQLRNRRPRGCALSSGGVALAVAHRIPCLQSINLLRKSQPRLRVGL